MIFFFDKDDKDFGGFAAAILISAVIFVIFATILFVVADLTKSSQKEVDQKTEVLYDKFEVIEKEKTDDGEIYIVVDKETNFEYYYIKSSESLAPIYNADGTPKKLVIEE